MSSSKLVWSDGDTHVKTLVPREFRPEYSVLHSICFFHQSIHIAKRYAEGTRVRAACPVTGLRLRNGLGNTENPTVGFHTETKASDVGPRHGLGHGRRKGTEKTKTVTRSYREGQGYLG